MVCPVWSGRNLKGQQVCADSFWTKRAGCNSAIDRVSVENGLRPQYSEYINLDASGIRGQNLYDPMVRHDIQRSDKSLRNINNITGRFGLQNTFQQNIYPGCQNSSVTPYAYAMAQESQSRRGMQSRQQGFYGNQSRKASGFAGV